MMATTPKADIFNDKILDMRKAGMSKENIAFELGIDKRIVYRALEDVDPKPAVKPKLEQVLELYDEGLTYEEIAQAVGWKVKSVRVQISLHSKTFQPIGKLNHFKRMSQAEYRLRKRQMTGFLMAQGAWTKGMGVWVMHDHQYKLEIGSAEDADKLRALFPKAEIAAIKKHYWIVRKVF
jgi:hypothetical protein